MTLGEIVRLHNRAVADKGSNDEYYGDFPDITCRGKPYLHDCAVANKGSPLHN